ncbi:myristoylated alanine-rich C-kinase substrate-like [Penaeus vannamei]|uniref:myristoylated alanine-rich C-kinase substrate-like n=1 Tax=Penaeus vannamei TaxID=6689 RepID=UPI00387FABE2
MWAPAKKQRLRPIEAKEPTKPSVRRKQEGRGQAAPPSGGARGANVAPSEEAAPAAVGQGAHQAVGAGRTAEGRGQAGPLPLEGREEPNVAPGEEAAPAASSAKEPTNASSVRRKQKARGEAAPPSGGARGAQCGTGEEAAPAAGQPRELHQAVGAA